MNKNMPGKALPFSADEWPEIIDTGLGILNDNSWYPLCTFLTGTPDETEKDVLATLELMDKISDKKLFYVPLLFIPIEGTRWGSEQFVGLENVSELQWEILSTAWDRNLKIWKQQSERTVKFFGFWVYWLYLRWKHGGKSVKPVMRFFGLLDQYSPRPITPGPSPVAQGPNSMMQRAVDWVIKK